MMMMMIVLRLLSLPDLNKVFFQGGGVSVDSWTLGPKPLCHRHPTGPHPSGLLWTPAKGDPTKADFALTNLPEKLGDQGRLTLVDLLERLKP